MKIKTPFFLLLGLSILLGACSSLITSSGEQPTPVIEENLTSSGYQNVTIDHVEVQVGIGSPIPVYVLVSGQLPDPCSQVEHIEIKQDGSTFILSLFATPDIGGPAVDGCIKDPIPFTLSIPLSVVDLPSGSYSVFVNGSRADFVVYTANSTSSLRTADMPYNKSDILVDDVTIEVGVGSPIPVHAIVSANLPNACAQLGEVRIHRDGTSFFVKLIAYVPAQTDCNPDTLPIRIEIPLNIIGLETGISAIIVNGIETTFEMPGS